MQLKAKAERVALLVPGVFHDPKSRGEAEPFVAGTPRFPLLHRLLTGL
jgi:hypothetical protein